MSWRTVLKNMQPQKVGIWYSPNGWVNTNTESELADIWDMSKKAGLLNKAYSNSNDWFDVGLKFVGKTILFKNEYQDEEHQGGARGIAGKFGILGEYDKEHDAILDSILEIIDDAGFDTKEYALSYFDKNQAKNYLTTLQSKSQKPKGIFGRFRK
ncbi:hypothetical protein QKV95_gp120 [Poseidoniales virus YSH_150918]|uniref:Uncharacterized protein n=1 Tax=Poseidoniales virus YSH_150918 TaxID=3071324 RepID=A0A976UB24_9CAUD|nr:hypothetical protein QKV95_gp120 [Yangshan Harbor Poseidoniales virus]UVF62597.1 hypothetical protein [Poseidoniales virus YSH_150918]